MNDFMLRARDVIYSQFFWLIAVVLATATVLMCLTFVFMTVNAVLFEEFVVSAIFANPKSTFVENGFFFLLAAVMLAANAIYFIGSAYLMCEVLCKSENETWDDVLMNKAQTLLYGLKGFWKRYFCKKKISGFDKNGEATKVLEKEGNLDAVDEVFLPADYFTKEESERKANDLWERVFNPVLKRKQMAYYSCILVAGVALFAMIVVWAAIIFDHAERKPEVMELAFAMGISLIAASAGFVYFGRKLRNDITNLFKDPVQEVQFWYKLNSYPDVLQTEIGHFLDFLERGAYSGRGLAPKKEWENIKVELFR